jgi:hypothetical protein
VARRGICDKAELRHRLSFTARPVGRRHLESVQVGSRKPSYAVDDKSCWVQATQATDAPASFKQRMRDFRNAKAMACSLREALAAKT